MTTPATTFLAETHERFLRAVVARLPVERIIELHLFPSIKQGGVESGVAVVAAVPEGEVVTTAGRGESALAPAEGAEGTSDTSAGVDAAEAEAAHASASAGAPPQRHDAADGADAPHPNTADGVEPTRGDDDRAHEPTNARRPTPDALQIGDTEAPIEIDADEAERLEDAVHAIVDEVEDPAAQTMAAASLELADLPAAEPARRYTIYSARYRLVLKGPDRGKWAVDIVAQADAPLVTVESVVRGVQRRAGDADEVGRWSGDELRVALRMPAPGAAAPPGPPAA